MAIPHLTHNEMMPLLSLRMSYPIEFNTNQTAFFQSEMVRYIKQKRVWRVSIMGEVRGGKSEVGSTCCFWYVKVWNHFYNLGFFKKIDLFKEGRFKPHKLTFEMNFLCDNQQIYKERLKKEHKKKTLRWGQIWQIDEAKKSEGGVGSISDIIETTNLNNIIAKFNQSEIWIQPERFETHNCPYGLKVVKKDEKNRVNWCLLFKIEAEPNGAIVYKFLGWVCVPMHSDEKFRDEYNEEKNEWIAKELSGRADERMKKRSKCAEMLVKKYPKFFSFKDNNKGFKYSQGEQLQLLNRLIIKNKINTNFNEMEKYYIIIDARMIAEVDAGVER